MSTITREHLEQALANPTKITFNYGETLELARIALASLEAEPVAWTDEQELWDVENIGIGYLFAIDGGANKFADPRSQIMLFTAPPAPVVPDEMAISDDMNLYQKSFAQGHNACRAAIIKHGGE